MVISRSRVRVEQVILGLEALNPNLAASSQVRITVFPDPTQRTVYTLDPESRTAIQGPRDLAGQSIGGGDTFSVPLGWARFLVFHRSERLQQRYGFDGNAVSEMPLGTRRIAGIDAVGKRITITIPVGLLGNDRPMEIVDERWESPELKLTIYSRTSDPRAGIVEYRLTNVKRTEPAADLFVLPADYTLGTSPKDDGWIRLYFAEPPKGAVGPRRK